MVDMKTFRISPGQTTNGITSAVRSIPASHLIATRREITDQLAELPIGGVAHFETKWNRAADLAGATSVTVERIA